MRRRLAALLATVAIAAGALPGCGGRLEGPLSDTLQNLNTIGCSIERAVQEHANYEAAAALQSDGKRFMGDNEMDDISVELNRVRIFISRVADLGRSEGILAALEPDGEDEEALVEAARTDLAAAKALMMYDQENAPGATNAPAPPSQQPGALREAVEASDDDQVKEAVGSCPPIIDLGRRSRAYEASAPPAGG